MSANIQDIIETNEPPREQERRPSRTSHRGRTRLWLLLLAAGAGGGFWMYEQSQARRADAVRQQARSARRAYRSPWLRRAWGISRST